MLKSSRLFSVLVAVFLVAILVLTFAIFRQRQHGDKVLLKRQLEFDGRRIELASEQARLVVQQKPMLTEMVAQLEPAWAAAQEKLYLPTAQKEIEGILGDAARDNQLTVTAFEATASTVRSGFKEHTFTLKMQGAMQKLEGFAADFYKQDRLAIIDLVSVVSADGSGSKARIKVVMRYFEGLDPVQVAGGAINLKPFEIPLDYMKADLSTSDSVYGTELNLVREKTSAFSSFRSDLEQTAQLERKAGGLKVLTEQLKLLEDTQAQQKKAIQSNLPTLYLKVRSSPLGSVALQMQGSTVRFPEVADD